MIGGGVMIEVKVIADSIGISENILGVNGKRLITLQLKYPRFIHSEFMTHRMFSRNASSSRAIPVSKMREQVETDPAMPIHWGKNQPGMQANEELDEKHKAIAKDLWLGAAKSASVFAQHLLETGAHKQIVNRILEPFQWIHVVVTATEWDNFFALRDHPAAQPEIRELARIMKKAIYESEPEHLDVGEWHLPYVTKDEINDFIYTNSYRNALKCSAARCARVSYMKHDGTKPNVEEDLELFNQLATRPFTDKRGNVLTVDDPVHMSPVEHQATPAANGDLWSGNFHGWHQWRKILEIEKEML
jgi:thymidylate synthase ThyX